jgi:5-deoxy-glucuronate isomerase
MRQDWLCGRNMLPLHRAAAGDSENSAMSTPALDPKKLLVTNTASHRGRRVFASPDGGVLRHLCYARILLDGKTPEAAFDTGNRETGLLCMKGACKVAVGGQPYDLGPHDGMYVPRGSAVEITTGAQVDLVEVAADVEGNYPLQVVRYDDVKKDPTLKFTTGGPTSSRDLNIVLGKNVKAGRIVAGFTTSHPGHWTSWPPHQHAQLLEEAYLYYDMPAPAFGIQLVYDNTERPEFVEVVRDGDLVMMPSGYHPNVSVPGHTISFVWMMAAHREVEDRVFGVVNVQPGFDQAGSGLEASRK